MKIYKILFMNSMIMGTLVAISSYSWMSMWMGLEINLLSIIPLFSNSKNMFSSESSMKYFITQAMASLILLTAMVITLMTQEFINPLVNFLGSMMMTTALMTKLGAAPFHFWFPEVIEGLNWFNSLILLTWQKIAPMILIMNMNTNLNMMLMIIIMSLIMSTISGFNQISLRKIMAYSSINHIAWMLSTTLISMPAWTTYFVIYSLMNINIISIFSATKSFYINQITSIMNNMKTAKFSLMTNFLSLGGLPPFIGFMPKWITINWMTNNNMLMITLMMIITTLVMLFIYIRMILSSMTLASAEPKTVNLTVKNTTMMFINVLTLLSLTLCTMMINIM